MGVELCVFFCQFLIHVPEVKILLNVLRSAHHTGRHGIGRIYEACFLEIIILNDKINAKRFENKEEKEKIISPDKNYEVSHLGNW
jgi:hypothetical protein